MVLKIHFLASFYDPLNERFKSNEAPQSVIARKIKAATAGKMKERWRREERKKKEWVEWEKKINDAPSGSGWIDYDSLALFPLYVQQLSCLSVHSLYAGSWNKLLICHFFLPPSLLIGNDNFLLARRLLTSHITHTSAVRQKWKAPVSVPCLPWLVCGRPSATAAAHHWAKVTS